MALARQVILVGVPAILGVAVLLLALRGALSKPDTPPSRRRLMAGCFGLTFILWGALGVLNDRLVVPGAMSILFLVGIVCGVVGSILLFAGSRSASVS